MKKILLFVIVGVFCIIVLCLLNRKEEKLIIPVPPPQEKEQKEKQMLNPKKIKNIVVYDFWANWCPPCKQFAPTFDAWKKKYSTENIKFEKINIEEDSQTAVKYKISSIPTVIVVVDGVEVKRWTGAPKESDLVDYLK